MSCSWYVLKGQLDDISNNAILRASCWIRDKRLAVQVYLKAVYSRTRRAGSPSLLTFWLKGRSLPPPKKFFTSLSTEREIMRTVLWFRLTDQNRIDGLFSRKRKASSIHSKQKICPFYFVLFLGWGVDTLYENVIQPKTVKIYSECFWKYTTNKSESYGGWIQVCKSLRNTSRNVWGITNCSLSSHTFPLGDSRFRGKFEKRDAIGADENIVNWAVLLIDV